MKKFLKIGIAALLLGLLGYMGFKIWSVINHKNQVAANIATMPPFTYQNIAGGLFSNANLLPATPTIFVYFNSDCEFCNQEAAMISENLAKFRSVQLVFVSFEKPAAIAQFAKKHKLTAHANLTFVADTKASFATTFDVKSLPCLVLYDKNQHLIEKLKGQTKTETLLKKLQ